MRLPRNRNLVLQRLLRSIPLAFINIPLLGNIIVFTSFVFYLLLLFVIIIIIIILAAFSSFSSERETRETAGGIFTKLSQQVHL